MQKLLSSSRATADRPLHSNEYTRLFHMSIERLSYCHVHALTASLDHETALKRRANASALDRIEQEKAAFHARVEAAYEELAVRHAQRFICVDAARKPKEITDDILQALFTRMQTAGVA